MAGRLFRHWLSLFQDLTSIPSKAGGGVAADPRKSLFLKRRFLLNGTFAFSALGDGYHDPDHGAKTPLLNRCHHTDYVAPETLSVTFIAYGRVKPTHEVDAIQYPLQDKM